MDNNVWYNWEPNTFRDLLGLVTSAITLPKDTVDDQANPQARRLQAELAKYREALLHSPQPPGPNDQHRTRLRDQKIAEINGVSHQLSDESAQEALRLSDFLKLDEYVAVALVHYGVEHTARFERPAPQTGALLFYSEILCRYLTVEFIVKASMDPDVTSPIRQVCEWFVADFFEKTDATAASPLLTDWLNALQTYKTLIAALKKRKTQARSLPSQVTMMIGQSTNTATVETELPYGEALVDEITERLAQVRVVLANTLYLTCYTLTVSPPDLIELLHHLQKQIDLHDPATVYFLMAGLAAFDLDSAASLHPAQADAAALFTSASHNAALTQVNELLTQGNGWNKCQAIRGLLLLQWCQFLLLILHRYPAFEAQLGFREDRIEQAVEAAIQLRIFHFTNTYCLAFKRIDPHEYDVLTGAHHPDPVYPMTTRVLDEDFQWHIVNQLSSTVTGLIANMSSILRRMRYREEDSYLHQHQQMTAMGQLGSSESSRTSPNPQHHIQDLFTLVATLYTDSPDMGLRFWVALSPTHLPLTSDPLDANGKSELATRADSTDERLHIFLKWAADCRIPEMVHAYYNMLGSLALGVRCAQYAYIFLGAGQAIPTSGVERIPPRTPRNMCSWAALFSALQFYAQSLRQAVVNETGPGGVLPNLALTSASSAVEIPPEEVALIESFLRLLRNVVASSIPARVALSENSQYQVLHTLFDLLGCRVPITLKAAILRTIAAFCRTPLTEQVSASDNTTLVTVELTRQVWHYLEMSQTVITTHDMAALQRYYQQQAFANPSTGSGRGTIQPPTSLAGLSLIQHPSQPGGLLYELEEVESVKEIYPETIAFIHLLLALIHPPSELANRVPSTLSTSHPAASPSFPVELGGAYRLPGICPYTAVVLDQVLLKAELRGYRFAEERWQVLLGCLQLVERCLLTFDLTEFLLDATISAHLEHGGLDVAQVHQSLSGSTSNSGKLPPGLQRTLRSLVLHPGFDVMLRLLSGSKLLEELLALMHTNSVDVLNAQTDGTLDDLFITAGSEDAPKGNLVIRSVLQVLRILKRTIQLQNAFLNQLYPMLCEPWVQNQLQLPGLTLPHNLVPLDQLMLYRHQAVVDIALYINCRTSDAVCLLAVECLAELSASTEFCGSGQFGGENITIYSANTQGNTGNPNRLVTLLDGHEESLRILYGFLERLECEEPESPSESTHKEDPTFGATPVANGNIIRLAIVDLLLENLSPERGCPSVAHWLLGFNVASASSVKATEFEDSRIVTDRVWGSGGFNHRAGNQVKMSCFHVILNSLRQGIDTDHIEGDTLMDKSYGEPEDSLAVLHPVYTARCYQLMYRLCVNSTTGPPVIQYLRELEQFYPRQLQLFSHSVTHFIQPLPPMDPEAAESLGDYQGWRTVTDVTTLFHQRAWLLRGTALELQLLASTQERSKCLALLGALFNPSGSLGFQESLQVEALPAVDAFWARTVASITASHNFAQHDARASPMIWWVLEMYGQWSLVSSLFATLFTSLETSTTSQPSFATGPGGVIPDYFADVDLRAFYRTDKEGCPVYDLPAVHLYLQAELARYEQQGRITTAGHHAHAQRSLRRILQTLFVKSEKLKVAYAYLHFHQAWQRVVEVALTTAFAYLCEFQRDHSTTTAEGTLLNLNDRSSPDPTSDTYNAAHQPCETLLLQLLDVVLTRYAFIVSDDDHAASPVLESLGLLMTVLTSKLGDGLHRRLAALSFITWQDVKALLESTPGSSFATTSDVGGCATPFGSAAINALTSPAVLSLESRFPVEWIVALWDRLVPCSLETSASVVLRGNMHTALLYTLGYIYTIVDKNQSHMARLRQYGQRHGQVLQVSQSSESRLKSATFTVLQTHGERLLTELCRDATNAPDVWRPVTFGLLERLVRCFTQCNGSNKMVQVLAQRAHLRHQVTVIKRDELGLAQTLQSEPATLNPLFVHEQKMMFLLRICQTREGVDCLYNAGLLDTLDDCEILELRPDGEEARFPLNEQQLSTHSRYHQILLPTLRLLLAMVSKPSRDQSVITDKVVNFLCHHRRAFEFLLLDDVSGVNVTVLQEMKLFTSLLLVLAKARPPKVGYPAGVSINNLFGFDTLVFALLTRYKDPTVWKNRLVAVSEKDQKDAQTTATNLEEEYTQLEMRAWDDIVQMLCNVLDLSLLTSETPYGDKLPDQQSLAYPVDSTAVFRPRFTWVLTLSTGDDTNVSFGQRYPSLGSLAVALAHALKDSQ
ncbi:hypothetical protein IWQ61_009333, partial [Dispira simplex]